MVLFHYILLFAWFARSMFCSLFGRCFLYGRLIIILTGSVDHLWLFPAPAPWTTILGERSGACLSAICGDWRRSSRYTSQANQAARAPAHSVPTIDD